MNLAEGALINDSHTHTTAHKCMHVFKFESILYAYIWEYVIGGITFMPFHDAL